MAIILNKPIKMLSVPKVDPVQHNYIETSPCTKLLTSGSVIKAGHRPLLSDILFEQDVVIPMRDGVNLFADVYRPPNAKPESVPAIIVAGPFGKQGGPNRMNFDKWPWRFGCPRQATTGLEKFEGPDPGYWCYHGYAVVHTDARGTWKSGGDAQILPCEKEGEDNYDIIEFVASQSWSNGKTTMCGNSYLAMTQWWAGAAQPPHLTCLAPWEAQSDVYNDMVRRGGIPNPGFAAGMRRGDIATLHGSKIIDLESATYDYPTLTSFWEGYRPPLERIQCPVYIVGSWTNPAHVYGTFRAWSKISSKNKWLRVHGSHEWPDLYDSESVEDLRKFYDCYLKNVNNGWKFTPKVRLCILNPGGRTIVNRPESSFPLARQQPLKLYLDANTMTLSTTAPTQTGSVSYDATTGDAMFRIILKQPLEFTGYIKLRVWAEAIESTDMDMFAFLQKFSSTTGQLLESTLVDVGRLADDPAREREALLECRANGDEFTDIYFDNGPVGMLRASHRALNKGESTDLHPVYIHLEEELLRPGEVVPLDIGFWPYGMVCAAGEELRLTISGTHYKLHLRPGDAKPVLRNKGIHKFYTGGDRESYLLLPVIPEASET